ncbi:MAG: hypothetical protein LYZ66_06880 [Nitrososphaerales archaeon]|nr:hypothetical protein [Nitrososphaerales archaeon]
MGATLEARPPRADEFRASSIRRPLTLRKGDLRLSLEPDGTVRFLQSLREGRLLFGREQLQFYKAQSGILMRGQRPDWTVRLTHSIASLSASIFQSVEASQRLRLLPPPAEGYARTLVVRNIGSAPVKVRLISLQDPTAAHFREKNYDWGALGVNAFNRSSHIAMDEVADSPAARVVGAKPQPKLFHMTSDPVKAAELLQAGELSEPTAGMSGQVLVLAEYEFDLPVGGSSELNLLSLYDPTRLEGALSGFEALSTSFDTSEGVSFSATTSSPAVTAAASWAKSALEGVEYEADALDRYEAVRGVAFVDPRAARSIVERARASVTRSGSLGHSADQSRPGLLDTAVFLEGTCLLALLSPEKKYARSLYTLVKKLIGCLMSSSSDGVVRTDPSLPQGWRRKLGRGHPTGEIPEVSLSVASALYYAACLASRLGKGVESARWAERSKLVTESVKTRMLDERGYLALCFDGGKLRSEETVDQAVACYRAMPGSAVASSEIHRLLEKDFESGWGPRTVPTTNRIYFNATYGEGQLGGYWTRAALAHAVLAYRAGLAGIGSIELEAIARLPSAEAVKLGGAPGEFPYWVDLLRREAHGPGSDPVAASRFLEALVCGELGLSVGSTGLSFNPSPTSRLKWLLLAGVNLGKRTSVFVGRGHGRAYAFAAAEARIESGWKFSGAEAAESHDARLSAVSFFGPGQTVCVGNGSEGTVRSAVSFRPRDPALAKHLSVELQELETSTGSWKKVSTVRVLSSMSIEAVLGPHEWRAFRVSASY